MQPIIVDRGDVSMARLSRDGRAIDLFAVAAQNPQRYPFLLESSARATVHCVVGQGWGLPARREAVSWRLGCVRAGR